MSVDAIRTIRVSPGVSGTFTIEQALQQLLAGTNVTFRLTGPASATLELRIGAESVDVTGPRQATRLVAEYTAPLRDIPQTIEVIPRAAMEAQGVTTLSEALRNVPGITLQAGEGGGASSTAGDMFNMRGFNASNSLFVDGVRDDGLVSRDVFNLEQVEVFMGPTGSDVGRGTAAGYVNMQTKTPHLPRVARGHAHLRHRRSTARDDRPQPAALARANSDSWIRQVRRPPQRALAGQRRRRPRRGRERDARPSLRPSALALARRRAFRRRADSSAAQLARLRHSRRRLAGFAADADDGAGAPARSIRATTTAARPTTTTTPSQNTLTARVEHDLAAALDGAQSDPLQPDGSAKRSSARCKPSPRTCRQRPGHGCASRQRARKQDHVEPDQPVRDAS